MLNILTFLNETIVRLQYTMGEMAEWLKAPVLKPATGQLVREFESHSLRH